MIQYRLAAILLASSIQLSGQHIQINDFQARCILKDHAELLALRRSDSIFNAQVQALTNAYYYKDSALVQSGVALVECGRIGQDYAGLYHESEKMLSITKKEIRKQKILKWVGLGGGLLLVLVLH